MVYEALVERHRGGTEVFEENLSQTDKPGNELGHPIIVSRHSAAQIILSHGHNCVGASPKLDMLPELKET